MNEVSLEKELLIILTKIKEIEVRILKLMQAVFL